MRGSLRAAVAAFGLAALLVAAAPGSGTVAAAGVRFATPISIDQQLAGGEPEVLSDPLHGTLVYTSHEGTTHLYRNGLITSPWGDFSFVTNYCNQVNVWTSRDGGVNWFRDRYLGSPCPSSPAINTGFSDPDLTVYNDANGKQIGIGVSTWSRGDAAFTPHFVARSGPLVGFFPVIAVDRNNTIYSVWTPDQRQAGTTGGCSGAQTPAPNSVQMSFSKDWGKTWSAPATIVKATNTRVVWPWVIAGDAGKVSIVWYQTDPGELADLDCQPAHIHAMEATVLNATSSGRAVGVVDAAGRVIH